MTIAPSGDRRKVASGSRFSQIQCTGDVRPERTGRWGRFQVWVGVRNLTQAVSQDGKSTGHVECPLLPIVTGVVQNWDCLFHESRLPRSGSRFSSYARWHSDSILDQLVGPRPDLEGADVTFPTRQPSSCPLDPMAATRSGHGRALDFRESLGVNESAPLCDAWDLEKIILPRLGITIHDFAPTRSPRVS